MGTLSLEEFRATWQAMTMDEKQIIGEARVVFDKLPDMIKWSIEEALEDRPHKVISSSADLFDTWLMYIGIIGFSEDILEFFKAMK